MKQFFRVKRILRILTSVMMMICIAGFTVGCGAAGASIFMNDGSIVNIGDATPQTPEGAETDVPADSADAEGGGADAGTVTDPTGDEAYDPSKDPYITGGGISPFLNAGGSSDPAQTPGADTADPAAADGQTPAAQPTDTASAQPAQPRDTSNLGGTAAEIISNVGDMVVDAAARKDMDLYVATTGNDDTNDGSYDEPFFSIQKALNTVTPGHTIYIMSGVYHGANTITASGGDGVPITITSYPGASVTVTLDTGDRGAIFDVAGHSNINISRLRIGYSYSSWVYGVFITGGAHDINVTECEFCNISCTAAPGMGGAYAVLVYGNGNTEDQAIKNVTIYNNNVHNLNTNYSEALAASGNVTDVKFTGNVVYEVSNIGIDLFGGGGYCANQQFDQPRNCEISGNTVYMCQSPYAPCAGIYVSNARDSVVKDNFVYENAYGIEVACENNHYQYPTTKISVSGNTVHNNHDGGITIGGVDSVNSGFVTESELVNNILYNNGYLVNDGANGEIHFEKVDGITLTDNIVRNHDYAYPVIGCGKTSEYVKNVKFNNNLYAYDKPEKIVFKFQGNDYIGLEAWNKFTGGTDKNSVEEKGKTK